MPLLDSKTVTIATVQQPTAQGQISRVEYWNPSNNTWVTTAPTVQYGQAVGVRAYGKNIGSTSQWMYLVLNIKNPSGVVKGTKQSSTLLVDPNAEIYTDLTVVSDAAGQWTADIQLWSS
jgi:hypothetical protein